MTRQQKELPDAPGKPVSVVLDGIDGWAGGATDPIRSVFADLQRENIEARARRIAGCSEYLAKEALGHS